MSYYLVFDRVSLPARLSRVLSLVASFGPIEGHKRTPTGAVVKFKDPADATAAAIVLRKYDALVQRRLGGGASVKLAQPRGP